LLDVLAYQIAKLSRRIRRERLREQNRRAERRGLSIHGGVRSLDVAPRLRRQERDEQAETERARVIACIADG